MGSLKSLRAKMLQINPSLDINNDEVIISNLVIGRRLSKRMSEEELAMLADTSVRKLTDIEEGRVLLDDPDYQRVIKALGITAEEAEETLMKNKVNINPDEQSATAMAPAFC